MAQFGQYSTVVQDTAGNAKSGASVTIYREGAFVNGSQSGPSPLTVTVADRGAIAANDTVFINTITGTTYSVNATTATTVTLAGFIGTLVLTNRDRIVPSNSPPTLYGDDVGVTTLANPLTTSGLGFAQAYLSLPATDEPVDFDVLITGAGLTAQLQQMQAWPSPPTLGNIRWAHQFSSTTSKTGGIQEAINSITDASATNPYSVLLRPGIYATDQQIAAGTETGTADFTADGVTVTGTSTKFKSTQALTGTATFTNNNKTVTGIGTLFLTELQVGDNIQRTTDADDGAGADHSGTFGRVLSIETATSLTLEDDPGWIGTTGSGSIRFREFRVGDHIKASAHADTAYTRITSIASDTSLTISGLESISSVTGANPPFTGYQGATALGSAISKATFYRVGIATQGIAANGNLEVASPRDFITLAGMDRDTCIIKRNKAAGSLTAVIQAGGPNSHQGFSNLTIQCNGTRHIHWDTTGELNCTNVRFKSAPASANSAALSTGINTTTTASSYHRIIGCDFEFTQYSCHSNVDPGSAENFIWLTGNIFTNTGTIIGLDLSSAGANSTYQIMLSGNIQRSYNVDSGNGAVDLLMPTATANQPKVRIYTDGALRFGNSNNASVVVTNDTADYYFNAIIYPMLRTGFVSVTGVTSGDVMIFRPATGDLNTTTLAAQAWPVVACNQLDNTSSPNWTPRLCTGPYGACFVESAQAVTPGDTLVTSTTAKDAKVDNTVTDLTKVIGWAFNGKTAGARRLVIFRRNMTLAW